MCTHIYSAHTEKEEEEEEEGEREEEEEEKKPNLTIPQKRFTPILHTYPASDKEY